MTSPAITAKQRRITLLLLLAVYAINMVDRQILTILGELVRLDLQLSDTQLGFLTGFAFALFYAVAGLPIAYLADRSSRRTIIAVALAVWSGMTALSGMAQNFVQLALARIGVGIGEAGCSPPAHSILADLYKSHDRGKALGIYGLGIPIGTLFGLAAGGWLGETFGWRYALLIVGLPGIVLAVVVRFALVEPQRGAADGLQESQIAPPLREALRYLWRCRTFKHLAAGGALATAVSGAMVAWAAPFLMRSHGLAVSEVGLALGLIAGIPGAMGMYLGGALADRFGQSDVRWRLWIVSLALLICCPFAVACWLAPTAAWSLGLMVVPFTLCNFFFQATTFAQVQSITPVRMRAMAAAVLLFIMNIIGQGAGPQIVGILSDALKPVMGADSLGYSLAAFSLVALWAAWHYGRAGSHLPKDLR